MCRRSGTGGPWQALAPRLAPVRPVRDGFVAGAADPTSIVFFVATVPVFTGCAAGHVAVQGQMLVVGALVPVIAVVVDRVRAVAAGTIRQWLARSPRRLALIGGAGGLAMIGLGAGVAATGRKN